MKNFTLLTSSALLLSMSSLYSMENKEGQEASQLRVAVVAPVSQEIINTKNTPKNFTVEYTPGWKTTLEATKQPTLTTTQLTNDCYQYNREFQELASVYLERLHNITFCANETSTPLSIDTLRLNKETERATQAFLDELNTQVLTQKNLGLKALCLNNNILNLNNNIAVNKSLQPTVNDASRSWKYEHSQTLLQSITSATVAAIWGASFSSQFVEKLNRTAQKIKETPEKDRTLDFSEGCNDSNRRIATCVFPAMTKLYQTFQISNKTEQLLDVRALDETETTLRTLTLWLGEIGALTQANAAMSKNLYDKL